MKDKYRKINQAKYSLGDLVAAISSCSENNREVVAAVADLITHGRIMVKSRGHMKRIKLV